MPDLSDSQKKAANWLLRSSSGAPEDYIRKRIGSLLDSLLIDYELTYRSPFASGPCDIYLPRRRTIFETKVVGLADDPDRPQAGRTEESPKQQLERYLDAEISYELQSLDIEGLSDRHWTGILTDGRIWHVWRYAHEQNAVGTPIRTAYRPTSPESLVHFLQDILEGDLIGKPWIPTNLRHVFEPRLNELGQIYETLPDRAKRPTETKLRLWLEMLRTSSMEPENQLATHRLFVAHSFLVALARGVIHVLAKPAEPPDENLILGNGFVAWIVDTARGRQWADAFFGEIYEYEWRRRPGDVLRPLYEQFVDERDRKIYGEYYTPDWLAELIVREICDDNWCAESAEKALVAIRQNSELRGVGVLDPTCGSGTFLYHAALRILSSPFVTNLSNSDKAGVVCSLVRGIDIHPVAAEISRATLLRALPVEPPSGESALRIHEGDALFIHGDDEDSLFRSSDGQIRIETPRGAEVFLPRGLVERPTFTDDLRRLVLTAAEGSELPSDIIAGTSEAERVLIEECHRKFMEIIEDEGDSVWTWYIRNTSGPYRLSDTKVDRIVANPPWVRMADIQSVSRKRRLETFAEELELWVGGRQAPHFDIAQLFIKRTRLLYLSDPDRNPGAWLVKKSALHAGNWEAFRKWHQVVFKQYLDIESLKPFGGGDARRCCVLFEGRVSRLKLECEDNLVVQLLNGKIPTSDARLDDVLDRLSFNEVPPRIPSTPSDYLDSTGRPFFRQGATITPKVLTVVDRIEEGPVRSNVCITTSRSDKRPWVDIDPQRGEVPKNWVRKLVISKAVLPFAVSPFERDSAVVPINDEGSIERNASLGNDLWRTLDQVYDEHRGHGSNTPISLIARIDYGSNLTRQLRAFDGSPKIVVYPSSGDIMRACRLSLENAVIDSTLYWFLASTTSEASYLTALLNAPCLSDVYVEARESGRHFHLHPWRKIPIARFDSRNSDHVTLANLAIHAEQVAEDWLLSSNSGIDRLGQVGLSVRLREILKDQGITAEIDEIIQRILPDQVRR